MYTKRMVLNVLDTCFDEELGISFSNQNQFNYIRLSAFDAQTIIKRINDEFDITLDFTNIHKMTYATLVNQITIMIKSKVEQYAY